MERATSGGHCKKLILRGTIALVATGTFITAAVAAPPENSTLVRRASGVYHYVPISDPARVRGEERWQLLVHPDGTRDMLVWHDLGARNAQFTVVHRVSSVFRPLEVFGNYWDAGHYRGSMHFFINGGSLNAKSLGSAGAREQKAEVPATFSITSHMVAVSGWHTASYDDTRGGPQNLMIYTAKTTTDPKKPGLGSLASVRVERVGIETVDVPAGQFKATHYRFLMENDFWVSGPDRYVESHVWVTGPDRVVVKSTIPARDNQYLLVELHGPIE